MHGGEPARIERAVVIEYVLLLGALVGTVSSVYVLAPTKRKPGRVDQYVSRLNRFSSGRSKIIPVPRHVRRNTLGRRNSDSRERMDGWRDRRGAIAKHHPSGHLGARAQLDWQFRRNGTETLAQLWRPPRVPKHLKSASRALRTRGMAVFHISELSGGAGLLDAMRSDLASLVEGLRSDDSLRSGRRAEVVARESSYVAFRPPKKPYNITFSPASRVAMEAAGCRRIPFAPLRSLPYTPKSSRLSARIYDTTRGCFRLSIGLTRPTREV